ncbi:MAG: ABC transporter ATP-binding protein [Rhodospirillales bacterium 70-18]|nr:ABC transporter ATP-binding protein/permease [Rhodospirillales bacterium]OJY64143.1 MAG: ABC transporter ATP-binding protein [Rhodospirillales bacterium 70-18]
MRALLPFLKDVWRLALPYFRSEERWAARGLLAAIVALNLSMVGMNVVLNFWNRAFYNSLQDKDWDSFIRLLFTWRDGPAGFMPGFCGIAVVYILVAVYATYLNQWLQIRWRRWMTEKLLDQWLADRAYYRISLVATTTNGGSGTDNPDQRIAEDLRSFVASTLGLGLDLLSNVVTLFSFVAILWSLSGAFTLFGWAIPGYMVWVALVYAGLGTWATHLVGRPLAMLNFRQQRVEADFRFALVRLRENMEGVALQNGEADEHRGLAVRFEALAANWWAIMRRTKMLNALVAGYGQVATVFPIIVAAPRYFSGQMTLGGLTQTSGAFGQVQGAMSWFVSSYGSLAAWRATVERLATFQSAIEAARHAGRALRVTPAEGEDWRLEHVTLALPDGTTLLSDAALTLPAGRSVVVSGRSGAGKSTLFRALAGIWPFGSGVVRRPAGRVMFLPQRPYIPLGTLRHALTYPDAAGLDDTTVRAALRAAGLGHLESRLHEEEPWAQRLSGGEQQRLALARALLARPDWLFLDEATASLDPESEAELYATLRRELPHATIVSIAHNPALAALHDEALVFQPDADGRPGRLAPQPG